MKKTPQQNISETNVYTSQIERNLGAVGASDTFKEPKKTAPIPGKDTKINFQINSLPVPSVSGIYETFEEKL